MHLMALYDIAIACGTDKAQHGYCPHYESLLGYLRDKQCRLLEMGVQYGRSLRMWREWLPNAEIVGIDQSLAEYDPSDPSVTVHEGKQEDRETIQKALDGRKFDVVVDDAGHKADEQASAFGMLWDCISLGGWYIIEDLPPKYELLLCDMMAELLKDSICGIGSIGEIHLFCPDPGNGILFLRKKQ